MSTPLTDGLQELLNQFQAELQTHQLQTRKIQPLRNAFRTIWWVTTFWFVIWAILLIADTDPLLKGWGSVVMFLLFLGMFLMLWAVLRTRKKLNLAKEKTQLTYYQLLANAFEDRLKPSDESCWAWVKQTHLVKLQEDLSFGGLCLSLNFSTPAQSNLALTATTYRAVNQQKKTSKNGLLLKISLPKHYQNNLICFSIHNSEQYFDNVSLNRFMLNENQPKRLVKRHDEQVSHPKVDVFNQRFLVAGRNPNWLEDSINEQVVDYLLDLDRDFPEGVRLELDSEQLTAFLPCARAYFSPPEPDLSQSHPDLLAQSLQELAQIEQIATRLYELVHLL